MYGEDGTVQGLLSCAGYLMWAAGFIFKCLHGQIFHQIDCEYVEYKAGGLCAGFPPGCESIDKAVARVEEKLAYPVFVKPSNGIFPGVSSCLMGKN